MKRVAFVLLPAALVGAAAVALVLRARTHPAPPPDSSPPPTLRDVGPRYVSNQTSQPLSLHGDGFVEGMRLHVGAPVDLEVEVTTWDKTLAFARLPPTLRLPPTAPQAQVLLSLVGPDGAQGPSLPFTVVNDAAFLDPTRMAVSRTRARAYVLSPNTDQLFVVDPESKEVAVLPTGDGPAALAVVEAEDGRETVWVAHRFTAELWALDPEAKGPPSRKVPAPSYAEGLLVQDGVAYVAEHARDSVVAIELSTGRRRWRADVSPNPKALAFAKGHLFVGSLLAGEVQTLDVKTGEVLGSSAPTPKTAIVGGGTQGYGPYIMGGKAPRALAASERLGVLFVASIGPNIGPNPDRMEVSMNGGVGVVDLRSGAFVRHLGFGAGVPSALALDDEAGRLYVADEALGLVRVLDTAKLAHSDEGARAAVLSTVPLTLPEGFPLVRDAADFGVEGRASKSLHAGPSALGLSPDGSLLYVLNRFTAEVAVLRTGELAAAGPASPGVEHVADASLGDPLVQPRRRQGQILYHADLGLTAMSCEACHPGGHAEGVFFEKTRPLRIYRSTTLRGAKVTPPYFTPASTRSLAQTAEEVGSRNRFHDPAPTPKEVEALALYTSGIALLPNPFLGPDGAPPETLELPDGATGRPEAGRAVFQARCQRCHPPPHYTLDQEARTRGRYLDVGTPKLLPLREAQQDLLYTRFPIPSLSGAWDVFPLLGTGAAGFRVTRGGTLAVSSRFPLREVVETWGGEDHGGSATLSQEERDDLLAFLLCL